MSIDALDVIDRLPYELQARLEADEFFADIPVIVAEEGNVRAEMERKQAVITAKMGKRGVAVIVLQVICEDDYEEVVFGPLTLKPAFQVVENLEMNRDSNGTGKSARRVARRIRDVIKSLALPGITKEFVPDKPCIEPVPLAKELGEMVRAYQVSFRTWEADEETITQCEMPVLAAVEGSDPAAIALSTGTADAEIWYSLDDSFPRPNAVGSELYTGQIEIPEGGMTIRFAAYKTGCIASWPQRAEIEPV